MNFLIIGMVLIERGRVFGAECYTSASPLHIQIGGSYLDQQLQSSWLFADGYFQRSVPQLREITRSHTPRRDWVG
jgi:hypothetical protein